MSDGASVSVGNGGLGLLVEPIFEFAVGMSKLQLDQTELALLAAVLLMQSGEWRRPQPRRRTPSSRPPLSYVDILCCR